MTDAERRVVGVPTSGSSPLPGDRLADGLEPRDRERHDPVPSIARAPGRAALEPPDLPRLRHLAAGDPVGEVTRGAIAASVTRLVAHDPGVRLGDPEAVHRARVATRRLRSDLRTFRSLVEPEWSRSLRGELRWLGGVLGAVRDTEVLLGLLRAHAGQLDRVERAAAEPLLAGLAARGRDARARLLDALRSDRYAELLDRLLRAARAPALVAEPAARPAGDVLPALVAAPWHRLRAAVEGLAPVPADAALHAVRIRAKRTRYATEAAGPVLGKRARSFARALAALQDVLGTQHDAVVGIEWLRDARRGAAGSDDFVIGELTGLVRADERAARAAWPAAWKAARRARIRRHR